MSEPVGGDTRRRQQQSPVARRFGAWVVWWTLLMAFWTILDDSIALAELLAGAAAAALGAFLAELAGHQAATRLRMRIEWAAQALTLPGQVIADTAIVFAALWRLLVHGEKPASGFREIPVEFGDDTPEGVTRRVLLVGGNSVAPNTFVLGIDADRGAMIVHQLVVNKGNQIPDEQQGKNDELERQPNGKGRQ